MVKINGSTRKNLWQIIQILNYLYANPDQNYIHITIPKIGSIVPVPELLTLFMGLLS